MSNDLVLSVANLVKAHMLIFWALNRICQIRDPALKTAFPYPKLGLISKMVVLNWYSFLKIECLTTSKIFYNIVRREAT